MVATSSGLAPGSVARTEMVGKSTCGSGDTGSLKNAIMMIDFALDAERHGGKNSEEAIYQACLLRFRPILMTTMAAMLGGLPLAVGTGMGSELRRPLGITIVGGLIVSQALTLFTTPVVYLYFDRLAQRLSRRRARLSAGRTAEHTVSAD